MAGALFTDDNFQKEVLESDIPVLVDFWATWCGPCQVMKPTIAQFAEEYTGKMKIGSLDVEANPLMAEKYGIMSIPSLKIFKGGEVIEEMVGSMSAETLREKIKAQL